MPVARVPVGIGGGYRHFSGLSSDPDHFLDAEVEQFLGFLENVGVGGHIVRVGGNIHFDGYFGRYLSVVYVEGLIG